MRVLLEIWRAKGYAVMIETRGTLLFSNDSPLSSNHSLSRRKSAWARRCPSSEHTDASSAMGSELSKAACAGEVGLEVYGQTYPAECSEDDSEPDCS